MLTNGEEIKHAKLQRFFTSFSGYKGENLWTLSQVCDSSGRIHLFSFISIIQRRLFFPLSASRKHKREKVTQCGVHLFEPVSKFTQKSFLRLLNFWAFSEEAEFPFSLGQSPPYRTKLARTHTKNRTETGIREWRCFLGNANKCFSFHAQCVHTRRCLLHSLSGGWPHLNPRVLIATEECAHTTCRCCSLSCTPFNPKRVVITSTHVNYLTGIS